MITRIQDVDLKDIFKKYAKIDNFTADGGNRYKCLCPFHKDSHPSLILYDKTSVGAGWDYHCFACGAHGNAVSLLTDLELAPTEEDAVATIRRDFEIELPEKVTLEGLNAVKGLDAKFLRQNGWKDTADGVDIPYLDRDGNTISTKVRARFSGKGDKYFFRQGGREGSPYGLHWLDAYESDVIYIAEGETDCMTMRQAGFQVLGIPGARGFKYQYHEYLDRFKAIIIIRDNDEAGWGLVDKMSEVYTDNLYMLVLPKGVKDINNYHVNKCNGSVPLFTEYIRKLPILPATPQSFITAVKAEQVIPTEKLCWDMVMRCLHEEAERTYFKEQFCVQTKASRTLVNQCMKQARSHSMVKMQEGEFKQIDNAYYKEIVRDTGTVEAKITNFIVKPQYDISCDGEVTRVVDLVNEYGEEAHGIYFEPDTLSTTVKFNQRCMSSGNYIFTGDQQDLYKLCALIFQSPKETVYSPRMIGRISPTNWLFENCGIDSTGAVVPLYEGVVKLDGVTYKPRGIAIADDGGDTGNSTDMPCIPYERVNSLGNSYPAKLARSFCGTFGTFGAWLGLGWVVAGWLSDEIFSRFGFFPYLFITGKRASGKSVFCTLLQSAFGFNPNQAGMSIESPTNVGIMRYLAYRSSLPQWYDDYRNYVKRIQSKDNLLLDAYNRHGSVKGTATGGVTCETVKGFIMLSGEDIPTNNALFTRCAVVTLSAYEREPKLFEEARELMQDLPAYGLRWAGAAVTGKTEGLFDIIETTKQTILDASGDIRDASNKAIFGGAFLWAFGDCLTDKEKADFIQYLCDSSEDQVEEVIAEHPMAQFFDDFSEMNLRKDIDYIIEDWKVHIRLSAVFYAWETLHKGAPLTKVVLTKYIRKEPFFVCDNRKYFETVGQQRCITVKLGGEGEFPELQGFRDFIIEKSQEISY